jgi:hypothetical protein
MRDGTRLTIMTTGLLGVLCLLGSACSSGGGGMAPTPGGSPDGATGLGGGGATGAAGAGGGGATGTAGSDSSSYGGQTGPGSLPDAGLLPDVARPLDLAVSSDTPSAKPDLVPQPDTAAKPDVVPQPDFARKPDTPLQDDAGTRPEVGPSSDGPYKDGETSPDVGIVLYGLTPGTACFTITSVLPGSRDGCDIGIAELQGAVLPCTYDLSTGTFTLGNNGSLGVGPIRYNQGTLVRNKTGSSDPTIPGCSWNEAATTTLTMTDTNRFTISVVEEQDSIAAACGLPSTTCTSTWTWTMAIDSNKRGPTCTD